MGSMTEATAANRVIVQPEELKLHLTWTEGSRPSSYAQITNPSIQHVGFLVLPTLPDNYQVKPSAGILEPNKPRKIICEFTARELPPDEEQCNILVHIFYAHPELLPNLRRDHSEEKTAEVLHNMYCSLPAISQHAIRERVIPVRWVRPEEEIHTLKNNAVQEVLNNDFGLALVTLQQAIELRPDDGFLLLCRALVNHLLGQREGVKRDLQEAERLFSIFEGTGEHLTGFSIAYCIISDKAGVPTYTEEKLRGMQMRVARIFKVTEDQRLEVEARLTPSVMLRSDGNVDVIVVVDSLVAEVVKSEPTASYPDHFLRSLKIVVRPTGDWSESFSEGLGLIKCSPGNELNPPPVQRGRSKGGSISGSGSATPSAVLQVNRSNTSGSTSPPYGFNKSTKEGHALVCEYELCMFEDGSSTKKLGRRRFYRNPMIPEAVRGGINYPDLEPDKALAGKWVVSEPIAKDLRNKLEFTISLETELPAVRKCKMFSLKHIFKPPKHKLEVRKEKFPRICVFAVAGLKNFIQNSSG